MTVIKPDREESWCVTRNSCFNVRFCLSMPLLVFTLTWNVASRKARTHLCVGTHAEKQHKTSMQEHNVSRNWFVVRISSVSPWLGVLSVNRKDKGYSCNNRLTNHHLLHSAVTLIHILSLLLADDKKELVLWTISYLYMNESCTGGGH